MPTGPERSAEIRNCLVCTNTDCWSRGSLKLKEGLEKRLEAAGSKAEVKEWPSCFNGCEIGPNIVLYPEGTWYNRVQESDLDEIAAHISGGPRVDRLTEGVEPATKDLVLELIELFGG